MKSSASLHTPCQPLPSFPRLRCRTAALLALLLLPFAAPAATWQANTIEGWSVRVNEQLLRDDKDLTTAALGLLRTQLQEIARVVPAEAVARLRAVPLWFSPEYPGVRPRAEYHPGAGWLRANGRNADMVKAVEFTNVRSFAAETRWMPNFALHELAHAYHDRVLGNGHAGIKAAHEQAKAGGKYDRVERQDSEGKRRFDRAYALVSPQEYFAENTEAYFSRNDFFPFTRAELEQHDPAMFKLLGVLWSSSNATATATATATASPPAPNVAATASASASAALSVIGPPPPELNAPAFYRKYLAADGYPILASEKVNDYALREAAYLINLMLAKRPDVRAAMIKSGSRLCIMAHNEFTTELPGWEHLKPKDYWDARARGMGGSQRDPLCSCAEENLLAFPGDPYAAENILIHEFAHNIHLRGMVNVDPTFDARVKTTYDAAMAAGLWKGKYASVNHHEYFAEGVQSWFDNNRRNDHDHDHNHVHTRALLLEYDPGLAALCREVFGDTVLKYTKPATRLRDHLAGYDPATAPRFTWPARLEKMKAEIRAKAQARSDAAEKGATAAPKPAGK